MPEEPLWEEEEEQLAVEKVSERRDKIQGDLWEVTIVILL